MIFFFFFRFFFDFFSVLFRLEFKWYAWFLLFFFEYYYILKSTSKHSPRRHDHGNGLSQKGRNRTSDKNQRMFCMSRFHSFMHAVCYTQPSLAWLHYFPLVLGNEVRHPLLFVRTRMLSCLYENHHLSFWFLVLCPSVRVRCCKMNLTVILRRFKIAESCVCQYVYAGDWEFNSRYWWHDMHCCTPYLLLSFHSPSEPRISNISGKSEINFFSVTVRWCKRALHVHIMGSTTHVVLSDTCNVLHLLWYKMHV